MTVFSVQRNTILIYLGDIDDHSTVRASRQCWLVGTGLNIKKKKNPVSGQWISFCLSSLWFPPHGAVKKKAQRAVLLTPKFSTNSLVLVFYSHLNNKSISSTVAYRLDKAVTIPPWNVERLHRSFALTFSLIWFALSNTEILHQLILGGILLAPLKSWSPAHALVIHEDKPKWREQEKLCFFFSYNKVNTLLMLLLSGYCS